MQTAISKKILAACLGLLFSLPAVSQAKLPKLTFKKGYVVDKYKMPYPGWILHKSEDKISYKEYKNSKPETLGVDDVLAFSVEKDTFITIQFHELVADIKFKNFAKVLVRGVDQFILLGTYTEFKWRSTPNGQVYAEVNREMLLVWNKGDIFPLTKNNFYRDLPAIVSDNKILVDKIKAKKVNFNMMEEIIEEYEKSHNRTYRPRVFPKY